MLHRSIYLNQNLLRLDLDIVIMRILNQEDVTSDFKKFLLDDQGILLSFDIIVKVLLGIVFVEKLNEAQQPCVMFFSFRCLIQVPPVLCQVSIVKEELLVCVLECLQFISGLLFRDSFFVSFGDEFVFKFLFAESLNFSVYLSESLILLNAIV